MSKQQLPVEDVRAAAAQAGWTEVAYNEQSRVVSFKNDSAQERVNVYYTTGGTPCKGERRTISAHARGSGYSVRMHGTRLTSECACEASH